MGNVTLFVDKVVDLMTIYDKGHLSSPDFVDLVRGVLIDDGYYVEHIAGVVGSEEGQNITEG